MITVTNILVTFSFVLASICVKIKYKFNGDIIMKDYLGKGYLRKKENIYTFVKIDPDLLILTGYRGLEKDNDLFSYIKSEEKDNVIKNLQLARKNVDEPIVFDVTCFDSSASEINVNLEMSYDSKSELYVVKVIKINNFSFRKDFFLNAFNSMDNIIFIMDKRFKLIYCSNKIKQLLNIDNKEFSTLTYREKCKLIINSYIKSKGKDDYYQLLYHITDGNDNEDYIDYLIEKVNNTVIALKNEAYRISINKYKTQSYTNYTMVLNNSQGEFRNRELAKIYFKLFSKVVNSSNAMSFVYHPNNDTLEISGNKGQEVRFLNLYMGNDHMVVSNAIEKMKNNLSEIDDFNKLKAYKEVVFTNKGINEVEFSYTDKHHQQNKINLISISLFNSSGELEEVIGYGVNLLTQDKVKKAAILFKAFYENYVSQAISAYLINVTQNKLLKYYDIKNSIESVDLDIDYENNFLTELKKVAHKDDYDQCLYNCERKTIIENYHSDLTEYSFIYRTYIKNQYVNVKTTISTIKCNNDIYALMRTKRFDEEREDLVLELTDLDSLTNLIGRRKAIDLAKKRLDEGKLVALFIINIDNFKTINDTYGHNYGDTILQAVAGRLKNCFRKNDIVSRLDGDEFWVFCNNMDAVQAKRKSNFVLSTLSDTYNALGKIITITVSIGANCGQNISFDNLYEHSDLALYRSKKCGKNLYTVNINDEYYTKAVTNFNGVYINELLAIFNNSFVKSILANVPLKKSLIDSTKQIELNFDVIRTSLYSIGEKPNDLVCIYKNCRTGYHDVTKKVTQIVKNDISTDYLKIFTNKKYVTDRDNVLVDKYVNIYKSISKTKAFIIYPIADKFNNIFAFACFDFNKELEI